MSSVWDDPETEEIDHEDLTPLPKPDGVGATPAAPIVAPEKLEAITSQIVEKVVREVVPEIAERLIQQKIDEILNEDQE